MSSNFYLFFFLGPQDPKPQTGNDEADEEEQRMHFVVNQKNMKKVMSNNPINARIE